MSMVFTLEPRRRDEVLLEAAAECALMTLSRKSEAAWASHKTRCIQASPRCDRLVLEYPGVAFGEIIQPPFQAGENLGVAFRRGHKKCVFSSIVLDIGRVKVGRGADIESLALSWPQEVQELQRRAYYRAPVPGNRKIPVQIWRGGKKACGKTDTSNLCIGNLVDVSVGGVCILVPPSQTMKLEMGEPVGLQFQPDMHGPTLTIDAICRHTEPMQDQSRSIGFQLMGLEFNAEDRDTLQHLLRVVVQFQRYELRQAQFASYR